ncbi:PEP-CTERM sorting domain-containing protein [Rubrivivax sp. A210]|uniref:PEP-CTERM sorting domain-containing protein n=1 Tax=Rubrivivax sp. A210 TaxID=2772301 RepID=UPI00191A44A7|nr:PEP-CTERM sorting domain-containing protein [Rubrivivax sp. A210]
MHGLNSPFSRLALALAALTASASALAVPTYGDIASPPGVYFGTGNVNGNWTIDTTNNVEVALRIKDRATLATIDGSSGVYRANPGLCNPICGGSSKANWNYEFSVNTRANGSGVLDLTNVFAILEVDIDGTAGTNFTAINLYANWNDNSYWNGARTIGVAPAAGDYGVQQSANPLFANSGFNFLPGRGLYDLRLSVYVNDAGNRGALLASTSTQVTIPEPASLGLAGLALAGLAATRRRRG